MRFWIATTAALFSLGCYYYTENALNLLFAGIDAMIMVYRYLTEDK